MTKEKKNKGTIKEEKENNVKKGRKINKKRE